MRTIEKILFVDDDPICSYLNCVLIHELGIVKEATSIQHAEEALAYIKQHYCRQTKSRKVSHDLIFLDINMPGMDGFELLEELQQLQQLDRSRFSIILLSTSINPADKEKAAGFGSLVKAFLSKPLAEADILKLLTEELLPSRYGKH
jgi:CheY-like chemotaxis protein